MRKKQTKIKRGFEHVDYPETSAGSLGNAADPTPSGFVPSGFKAKKNLGRHNGIMQIASTIKERPIGNLGSTVIPLPTMEENTISEPTPIVPVLATADQELPPQDMTNVDYNPIKDPTIDDIIVKSPSAPIIETGEKTRPVIGSGGSVPLPKPDLTSPTSGIKTLGGQTAADLAAAENSGIGLMKWGIIAAIIVLVVLLIRK